MKKIILLLAIFGLTNSFGYSIRQLPQIDVLFVGNSLTYTNDMPGLFKELAEANSILVSVEVLAKPDYSLQDHWQEGKIQKLILSGTFDYVIIQQGPSSQKEGREMLLKYGKAIKALCDQKETGLVFFMVWPATAYFHTFEGVIENYRFAARRNKALLCEVGEQFKAFLEGTGDFSILQPDGFHPSVKGSRLIAKILFDCILAWKSP